MTQEMIRIKMDTLAECIRLAEKFNVSPNYILALKRRYNKLGLEVQKLADFT